MAWKPMKTAKHERSGLRERARRSVWACAIALGAVMACGKVEPVQSGETHFLAYCSETCQGGYDCVCGVCTRACESNAECASEPGAATCMEPSDRICEVATRSCDKGCARDADCVSLGYSARCVSGVCRKGTPTDSEATCPPGCRAVTGYPADMQRGCIDLERASAVACACTEETVPTECHRRASDGTYWTLPATELSRPDEWSPCSVEERLALPATACDFLGCADEQRPPSVCNAEDTCDALSCGSVQFDEAGCARAECSNDAACGPGQHCVYTPLISTSFCSYSSAGHCDCSGGPIAISGAFCNPVETPGLAPICDGTDAIRFAATGSGGFVDWTYPFLQPYGLNTLVVDGQCRYWAGGTDDGELRTGELSEADARELMGSIGWASFPEWSQYQDTESCPDAGGVYLLAPELTLMCTCGCGDQAPAGLSDALTQAFALRTSYAERGVPTEAVRVATFPYDDSIGEPLQQPIFPWPLEWDPAEVASAPLNLTADSGRHIEAAEEVQALRALRNESLAQARTPVARVEAPDGTRYGVLVRDEPPEAVARSVDEFLAR